ncbi:hypothetical protein A6R68_09591, partial [Neotoma lepida]
MDNHRICGKYEKVLHEVTKHFILDHENFKEKSYKYNEFGKVIHESSQCTPCDTSDTAENNKYRVGNHRDASAEILNLNRHKSGNAREDPNKDTD